MPAIEVKSTLTMDQIERNFKDVDFFSSFVDGLQEARDHKNGNTHSQTVVRKRLLPNVNVKSVRASLNLTQKAFANVLGVSPRTVEAWETGKTTPTPTAKKLIYLIQEDHAIIQKLQ